jgi:hypothetical protein
VIHFLAEFLRERGYTPRVLVKHPSGNRKPEHQLRLYRSEEVVDFLRCIRRYLIVKRGIAEEVINNAGKLPKHNRYRKAKVTASAKEGRTPSPARS